MPVLISLCAKTLSDDKIPTKKEKQIAALNK
jgi:hypothetical protein